MPFSGSSISTHKRRSGYPSGQGDGPAIVRSAPSQGLTAGLLCLIAYLKYKLAANMLGFAEFMSTCSFGQGHRGYLWWPDYPCLSIGCHTIHQSAAAADGRSQGNNVVARRYRRLGPTCNEGSASARFQCRKALSHTDASDRVEGGIAIAEKR